tara:strand:+ start:11 stop:1792 length:1782 start_codon:yes stop_codon:yes gene_type:complete
MSVLIDTLAYNTYQTAFNTNMVVNESFIDSATLRENVVSLARNIGYVPRSRTAAKGTVSLTVSDPTSVINGNTLTLRKGLVCTGDSAGTTYAFAIPEDKTVGVINGVADFGEFEVYEGTLLSKAFTVSGHSEQKFILDNPFIDTSTIRSIIFRPGEIGDGRRYRLVDNIVKITKDSEVFLLQEIEDEKYEILFGDGFFGKKLDPNTDIRIDYIVTEGREGNGARNFSFGGDFYDGLNVSVNQSNLTITLTTVNPAQNGDEIESINSVKYYAPRLYSSQYRAVSATDYEAIIQQIYPDTESVSVVGGEELDPPQFGNVVISIKPRNANFISDFTKQQITTELKKFALAGINQQLVDLQILTVEYDCFVYYNSNIFNDVSTLQTRVSNAVSKYANSLDLNKFGGRFKYSKFVNIVDDSDRSITSNITRIQMRRDLRAEINVTSQYELCYGNQFHVNLEGRNIKSTAFTIRGESAPVYFSDEPDGSTTTGRLTIVSVDSNGEVVTIDGNAGTVDYMHGEVLINSIFITGTSLSQNIIEIQATPESNDVIGLKDLYLNVDLSKSTINMIKDTISSGDQVSGVSYPTSSSYTNGSLTR